MGNIKIGITGSSGFIGWHLRCCLKEDPTLEVLQANEDAFSKKSNLTAFVDKCDVIVHLAGLNRGDEAELLHTNISLSRSLIEACDNVGRRPHIIFASSTHVDRDTAYGRSKRISAEMFREWEMRSGGRFTNLILQNVFGEHGKPFYNSVVATFCYQLAEGQNPEIKDDSDIQLIYAQDVAKIIREAALNSPGGEIQPSGFGILVSELLEKLMGYDELYKQGILPLFQDCFDVQLFNTYRSFLFPKRFPVTPTLLHDHRGTLFEALRTLTGGQCFISTTLPRVTRGNHYHTGKFERFLVVKGDAIIRIRRLLYEDVVEFLVSGEKPCFIDIPVLHTHDITNVGTGELLTLFWTNEFFDAERPDTYPENV